MSQKQKIIKSNSYDEQNNSINPIITEEINLQEQSSSLIKKNTKHSLINDFQEMEFEKNINKIDKWEDGQKNSKEEPNINNNQKVHSPTVPPIKSEPQENIVDSIISEIMPDYSQSIAIELTHVDLTFEVQNEKVDTLKESAIRFLKRDKNDKLKIFALKDVSFRIYKGEKVGIIGYNGAGKSTLLNVITGIYFPNTGTVKTYGKISPLLSLGAGFDYNYSGRKNIMLNGAVLGYEKEFLEKKMDEIIEFSELGSYIDIPIKNYSSGMLAKLGFSIATIVNPDILIIDEILGVGDVNFKKKSRDKIRSLMDGGTTVLFVSHSIPEIREICDKAIWIDEGKIKEVGEVNKVCDHYINDSEKATNKQIANIQFK